MASLTIEISNLDKFANWIPAASLDGLCFYLGWGWGRLRRGEYFYLVGGAHLQLILFSSCRNIQFGVFRAEIFILWCIVQKYWSGIVTCYMKMRQINELHADLASFLLNCARKKHFLGGFVQKCHFFWGLCRNITVPSYCTSGVLCRAFFRGCAEILIFGEIFTSV